MPATDYRKGSRTYRTLTFHYQRNPPTEVKEKKVTYRGAQAFLDKWEKICRESPDFQGTVKITRERTAVIVEANRQVVFKAYFEEI